MARYKITHEDVGFSSSITETSRELDAEALAALNRELTESGDLPEGVLSVESVSHSPDDSVHEDGRDEEGDVKVFVSVVLTVEADSDEDAEALEVTEILERAREALAPDLDMEGNWECLESNEVKPIAP